MNILHRPASRRLDSNSRVHNQLFAWLNSDIQRTSSRYFLNTRRRKLSNTSSASPAQKQDEKPFYVTTPIFYPNATPHIGHLHSLVTADIFARHAKLTNPQREVHFITGTDEHGMKIQKAARDKGVSEEELCDGLSQTFLRLSQTANISFTRFIRTSSEEHKRGVVHLWNALFARGHIYKSIHTGWYSISDECFYTDAQVRDGVDPKTGRDCKVATETGNTVEWTEEVNWKFRLSGFKEMLRERYARDRGTIYPPHHYDEIMRILSSPSPDALPDLSVSRPTSRISWGVRVPNDESQTIYVWLDALTTYLTGIGYPWAGGDGRQFGWPADVQVIGKDIIRFHTLYFPAFLLALDMPLTRTVLSHSHWTAERKKMSKSLGNVVDPFKAMEESSIGEGEGVGASEGGGVGVDGVRWYLARVGGRFRDDVDWSNEQLRKHMDELQSLLGNFYLRMLSKKILKRLPEGRRHVPLDRGILLSGVADGPENTDPCLELRVKLTDLSERVDAHLRKFEVADALEAIVDVLNTANKLFTSLQPWHPTADATTVLHLLTWSRETLRVCGILLQVVIPGKAGELLDALRVGEGVDRRGWTEARVGRGEDFLGGENESKRGEMRRVVLFGRGPRRE